MTTRHLMPLRAALGAGDGMGMGCGGHDGIHGEFHGASAFGGEYTARAQRLSLVFDHGSLMKEDLPSHFCALPESGSASLTYLVLYQCVSEEIDVGPELAAEEVTGLPYVFGGVLLAAAFKFGEDELAGVAAARGADLPKIRMHHAVIVGSGGAVFRTMEDGLAAFELFEDALQDGIGGECRFHLRGHRVFSREAV